jgi:hypothetical protein
VKIYSYSEGPTIADVIAKAAPSPQLI